MPSSLLMELRRLGVGELGELKIDQTETIYQIGDGMGNSIELAQTGENYSVTVKDGNKLYLGRGQVAELIETLRRHQRITMRHFFWLFHRWNARPDGAEAMRSVVTEVLRLGVGDSADLDESKSRYNITDKWGHVVQIERLNDGYSMTAFHGNVIEFACGTGPIDDLIDMLQRYPKLSFQRFVNVFRDYYTNRFLSVKRTHHMPGSGLS